MTSEFLSRIFKLVGIHFHTAVFMFLNPECTTLIPTDFSPGQTPLLQFFLETEEFTVNILSTKGLKNNIVL